MMVELIQKKYSYESVHTYTEKKVLINQQIEMKKEKNHHTQNFRGQQHKRNLIIDEIIFDTQEKKVRENEYYHTVEQTIHRNKYVQHIQ